MKSYLIYLETSEHIEIEAENARDACLKALALSKGFGGHDLVWRASVDDVSPLDSTK